MVARGSDVQSAGAKASNSLSWDAMRHGFPARDASGTWYAQAHAAAYRAYAGRSVENVSILVRKRVLKKSVLENYLYQRYVQGLVRCVGATHKRGRVWTSRKVFIAEDELNQKAYIPLRYTRECARREGGLRRWRIMISAHGACTHEF